MNNIKTVIIDLREEFELRDSHMESTDTSVLIVNIPMRAIFANKKWISFISETNTIYLICRSGVRSNKIKEKYFLENTNVISVDGGIKQLTHTDNVDHILHQYKINIVKTNGGLGLQQYMQIAFIAMLFMILILIYMDIDRTYLMITVGSFMTFIMYQIYSQSCLISSMIPLSN